MIRELLNFRIELVNRREKELESDLYAREFVRALGLKTYSGTWSEIHLDSPSIEDFVMRSREAIEKGIARFGGFCSLSQYIQEDVADAIEWYELRAPESLTVKDYGEIITCQADRMPANVHVSSGWSYNIYVSEEFKEVVEENRLRGIEFVWVKDVGKFHARQWFIPVVLNALGRGIDHPWFDSGTLRGSGSGQPTNPTFRHGVNSFRAAQIKRGSILDNDLQRTIISLFDPEILTISSNNRFLREFVPEADFAFVWVGEDQEREDGTIHKDRGICISKRAKDLLISRKLVSELNLVPVRIYETLPDGSELLDGLLPLPTPFFSYGHIDLESLTAKLEIEWERFLSVSKPRKMITMRMALEQLRKAKRKNAKYLKKPLKESELAESSVTLPENWIEVLKIANGGYINNEFILVSLDEIPEFHAETQDLSEKVDEGYPTNLLHVATCADGDWCSLEMSPETDKDCKVVRISHETNWPIQRWESIPEFIYDAIVNHGD